VRCEVDGGNASALSYLSPSLYRRSSWKSVSVVWLRQEPSLNHPLLCPGWGAPQVPTFRVLLAYIDTLVVLTGSNHACFRWPVTHSSNVRHCHYLHAQRHSVERRRARYCSSLARICSWCVAAAARSVVPWLRSPPAAHRLQVRDSVSRCHRLRCLTNSCKTSAVVSAEPPASDEISSKGVGCGWKLTCRSSPGPRAV